MSRCDGSFACFDRMCSRITVSLICVCACRIFFFQAEDGIRDLVRSRGLGDVYKRQRLAQLAQIGADVERVATMDAADAARGE